MDNNGSVAFTVVMSSIMGLFIFGLWFNDRVAHWQEQDDGVYTAIYVAVGVLVTLFGATPQIILIGEPGLINVAVVLWSFVASGSPMIMGSFDRHRKEAAEAKRRAANNAEDTLK